MRELVICVVCAQGLGTSLWIKAHVEEIVRKYSIPAQIMQTDLNKVDIVDADIVIGVDYVMDPSMTEDHISCITINDLLNIDDLEQKMIQHERIKPYLVKE